MTLRLSTRISIRWGDDPASEPTDTVVLSVGSYYMDLRVTKADQTVDWAFAGVREILCHEPLRCRWYHTIDSRNSFDPDEGSFENLPDGDSLETGSMPNPDKNGEVTPYEEIWRQIQPQSGSRRGWILQAESERGTSFLGQFNGIFLAMNQNKNGEFSVRKEELTKGPDTPQWTMKYQSGPLELPSLEKLGVVNFPGEEQWKSGDLVSIGGDEYKVCGLMTTSD